MDRDPCHGRTIAENNAARRCNANHASFSNCVIVRDTVSIVKPK
jgi:hypothetical protein